MAVAVTAMQLENDLKLVEDDLGSFIKSQKDILLKDKLQLERNRPMKAGKGKIELAISPPRQKTKMGMNNNINNNVNGGGGMLNLGGYNEKRQQVLKDERHNDYQQYLVNKSQLPSKNKQKQTDTELGNRTDPAEQRYQNRKEYRSNIDKEYGNMLRNKKNEELLYNHQNGLGYDSSEMPRTGKKIIEFDDSDDELFNYVLREKAKSKNNQRSSSGRTSKLKSYPEDGRSSSVPPPVVTNIFNGVSSGNTKVSKQQQKISTSNENAPYIFGGSSASASRKQRDIEHKLALERQMNEKQKLKAKSSNGTVDGKMPYIFGGSSHSMLKKEKNIEYKQALEEQIKQKEEEKKKEKLTRMGRIKSDMIVETDKTKYDQMVQYSEQNISKNVPLSPNENISQPVLNHNSNLSNYPANSAFNPVMNYPMGWGPYGAMIPNNFVPGNIMGLQQMQPNMQQINPNVQNFQSAVNGRYVPSAMDNNGSDKAYYTHNEQLKNNVDKVNYKSSALVQNIVLGESPQIPDMSAKRAQQIAYQQELKQQMEIKKATTEKEKKERERYEMKLEQEIAAYDPWGKSGCGAPVRTKDGKVVADLKKVLHGKDIPTNSEDVDQTLELSNGISPMMKALELSLDVEKEEFVNKELVTESNDFKKDDESSPVYGRGAALKELQGLTLSPRDKKDQSSYKEFLQQQVEEKKRKEEELKEKARMEEEKENKRLHDQQKRMREEYEQEKEKQRKKADEVRKQNEELSRIAEQKKLDEEMKRKKIEDERDAQRKRDAEKEAEKRKEVEMRLSDTSNGKQTPDKSHTLPRSYSPPVPAVRMNKRRSINEIQKVDEPNLENYDAQDYLNTIRNSLSNRNYSSSNNHNNNNDIGDNYKIKEKVEVKNTHVQEQHDLIRQLSALRKQLMRQEMRVQNDLVKNKDKFSNLINGNELHEQPKIVTKRNPFDRATSVTSGRKRQTFKIPEESTHLQYDNFDNAQKELDSQQQEYMKQQEMRIAALRHGVESKTLPVNFKMTRQPSKQSLLESESKFISMDTHGEVKDFNHGEVDNLNFLKINGPIQKFKNKSTRVNNICDDSDNVSITTLQVEDIARKNDERLANLNDIENFAEATTSDNLKNDQSENENLIQNFMQNQRYEVR